MALANAYSEHGEALEADFLHFWNQDINDMSIRRMRNLFFRLPPNSEYVYEVNETPQEARVWDVNTYMLANVLDATQAVGWYIVAANSKRTPKPPKPFPRPKTKKQEKKPKGYWPGKTIVVKE